MIPASARDPGGLPSAPPGAVIGGPRRWLRLEGLAVLVAAVLLYWRGGHSWALFALLFLAPDLSFAGYLAGRRVGAAAYNAVHSYVGPVLLAALALLDGRAPWLALVWAAHVGFDRALGYGLKYPTGFADTHLGRLGRDRRVAPDAPATPDAVRTFDAVRTSDVDPRSPVPALTDEARRLVAAAHDEAARLGHEYVGTEHLALALTRDASGIAGATLSHHAVDLDAVRRTLDDTVRPGGAAFAAGAVRPYTSRTRRTFELAAEYARELGRDAVGSEHVLLGMLRERVGIGAQVLAHHGLPLESAHAEVRRLSGGGAAR